MHIRELLESNEKKDLLRFSTAGSVDDGKSTLIGRLLYDSKTLYDDHISSLKKDSVKKGSAGGEIDYSLLLDGLKAEREQGITIDVAYRFFSTPKRKFIIADTPGHEQYTRNMATGASTSDLAVILVDATKGILPQTKRHSFIASLLGIKHILVAINKMDMVNYSFETFEAIRHDYADFAVKLSVNDIHFIPISALKGDNVVETSSNMHWYKGFTFLEFIETVHIASDRNYIDLRFGVQYVNRPDMSFRGFCGTLSSGVVRKGDEVIIIPSGQKSAVKSIVAFEKELQEAYPPMSVTLTLADEIDISRGDMIVHRKNIPEYSATIDAYVVWMNKTPLSKDVKYLVKQNNTMTSCYMTECYYKFNINELSKIPSDSLELNEIGRAKFELSRKIIFDPYSKNRLTGSFIIIDPISNLTLGAGMIIGISPERMISAINPNLNIATLIERKSKISLKERESLLKNKPFTVWITGKPGSGKTSLSYSLERKLFDIGFTSAVIDGENLRMTISSDLGFTHQERSENTRRAANIAKILNLNGIITIISLASPFEKDRIEARNIIEKDKFMLIYLDNGDVEQSMKYYEKPSAPDMEFSVQSTSVENMVSTIIDAFVRRDVIKLKP